MKLVVGLGNPGEEYAGTRHNVGFEVLEILARRLHASFTHDRRLTARVARGEVGGHAALLVQPMAYMNLSGPVVAKIVQEKELALADVLVVVDDYHLPVAAMRLREKGTAGGHNGLKSLIGSFGTNEFARLRIGIGEAPQGGSTEFVLTRFRPAERTAIATAYERGADCVEKWSRAGIGAAMNEFNAESQSGNPRERRAAPGSPSAGRRSTTPVQAGEPDARRSRAGDLDRSPSASNTAAGRQDATGPRRASEDESVVRRREGFSTDSQTKATEGD